MRKNKRFFIICIVFLLIQFIFVSCEDNDSYSIPSIGNFYINYKDRVYFTTETNGFPQILCLSGETQMISNLCYDSVCTHDNEKCSLYIQGLGEFVHIVIDQSKTNGAIVYIVARTIDNKDNMLKECLYKYDSTTGKKEILLKDWDNGSINFPTLWGNYIFFNSLSLKTGKTEIYRMNSDGSSLKLMSENQQNGLYIFAIDNNLMYLYDDLWNIYQTDENFSNIKMLKYDNIDAKKFGGFAYLYDGYLYYTIKGAGYTIKENFPKFNWHTMEYEDEFFYETFEIYRIKINDSVYLPEFVCDNTSYSMMMLMLDGVFYTVDKGYNYIGCHNIKVDGDEYPAHYIAYDCGIKMIDLTTLEQKSIFQNSIYNINYICSATDEYIIFEGYNIQEDYINAETQGSKYILYNRVNKNFTVLQGIKE